MGVIQEEYLIIQGISDFEKDEILKIDKWISKLPEEWKKLFVKVPTHSNGYLTYFMNWDGSKEGWEDSEKGKALRESFVQLCLDLGIKQILHIKPHGEVYSMDSINWRDSAELEGLDAPCLVCGKFEEVDSDLCESCRKEAIEHFKNSNKDTSCKESVTGEK